jgi:hypothetical protein
MPTDADLRTAYCIPVVRAVADISHHLISRLPRNASYDPTRQALRSGDELYRRLQSYLQPRSPYLEPTALTAASSRGVADANAMKELVASRANCPTTIARGPAALALCLKAVSAETREAMLRVQGCQAPTWLPSELAPGNRPAP